MKKYLCQFSLIFLTAFIPAGCIAQKGRVDGTSQEPQKNNMKEIRTDDQSQAEEKTWQMPTDIGHIAIDNFVRKVFYLYDSSCGIAKETAKIDSLINVYNPNEYKLTPEKKNNIKSSLDALYNRCLKTEEEANALSGEAEKMPATLTSISSSTMSDEAVINIDLALKVLNISVNIITEQVKKVAEQRVKVYEFLNPSHE